MYEEFRSLKNMTQKLKTKYEKFKTVLTLQRHLSLTIIRLFKLVYLVITSVFRVASCELRVVNRK